MLSEIFILIILLIAFVGCFYYRKGLVPKSLTEELEDFTTKPEQYHKKVVSLEAKVVKVFYDSLQYNIKRKIYNFIVNFFCLKKRKKRYRHLRFLITHPQFKKGKTLLVEYNLDLSPTIYLRKGSIIDLKGEYIHSDNTKKHFYGKIHWVHPPKGYLKVIKR